jgi:hypothetical protein
LAISKDDQRFLNAQYLLDGLYNTAVPAPSGGVGFRENLTRVSGFHHWLLDRVVGFWFDAWSAAPLDFEKILDRALERYQSRYLQLAAEVPEFMIWAMLGQHDASRATTFAGSRPRHSRCSTVAASTCWTSNWVRI